MRRPLRVFLALSLLWLALIPEPHRVPPSPLVVEYGSEPVDWSTLATKLEQLQDFYVWASQLPPPKPAKTSGRSVAPSVSRVSYPEGSVQQLILDVFGDAGPAALAVAKCESHFDPYAENGRYRGVFQVGDMHAAGWLSVTGRDYWQSWFDPVANVTYAHALYLDAGWGPWECKP